MHSRPSQRTKSPALRRVVALLALLFDIGIAASVFRKGALMLVEPRQHCQFISTYCNAKEAAASWNWDLVIAHGLGARAFWKAMICDGIDGPQPFYYQIGHANFSSGDSYSDFLKRSNLWAWLWSEAFSHVIITQTDVHINPSVSIVPYVMKYDYIGCRTRWRRYEYPPSLRDQGVMAVNGGFSLRSVSYALKSIKAFPANLTKAWPKHQAQDWSGNHEDVFFLWGTWLLGGSIPTGRIVERGWCSQKSSNVLLKVAVHKPYFQLHRRGGFFGHNTYCQ